MLFRSEEEARGAPAALRLPVAAWMTLDQCWALSADWYGHRLELDYQPPSREQRQAQLARVGLTGDPWSLG